MKGVLIYPIDIDDPRNAGVVNKMRAQHSAFQSASLNMDIITIGSRDTLIYRDKRSFSKSYKVKKILPFRHFVFYSKIFPLVHDEEYDFLYIRYSLITPFFIKFLKKLKKTNSQLKILLEIPTFPIAKEYRGFLRKILYRLSNQLANRYLPKVIDRIVVYGEHSTLYQIPTIKIRNGINLEMIPLKQKRDGEKLRLIATGRWAYWHGLDRILVGLANYCQKPRVPNIEMIIIGDGPELRKLKNLSGKLGLRSTVKFTGPLNEGELDSYFDHADIAVGSLGAHRKDLDIISSLKHREYAARGIPFILSDWDPDFPRELPWVRYFPNDESSIDINTVINFFNLISNRGTNTYYNIRKYAELNLTWSEKLKPVINYLFRSE